MKFDSTPLYEKIKSYLRDYIMQAAETGTEVRIDSERQMAEEMQVSRSSVNRAISELVVEGYLVKRRGKGVFILPKEKLEQKLGSVQKIALILPDISDYYYGVLAHEIERVAYDNGYDLMLCIIGTDHGKERGYLVELENKGVSGIISAPYVNSAVNADIYRQLFQAGIPVVLVNRINENMSDLPHIVYDQGEGSYIGVRHYLKQGRRNILYVGDFKNSYLCQLRKQGCVKALEEEGDPSLLEVYVADGTDFPERLLQTMADGSIDGIVCYNDIIAMTVCNVLAQAGRRVPEDVGIIGYDNSYIVSLLPVPLSSVDFPHQQMAKAAWQLLESLLRHEEAELAQQMPTRLMLRESSATI
ncbi:substrate-binding domain-containing protein [Paenibacillus nasutitermitis]|uniref:GntR family transcriptional regulator n=1 Tax=Paenibacillus nasutitermitis TaxID=1652958 RepID=A0A917DZ49_9BACL|nr:GntR family transcriptional regulator [Paenibacillus nasutitermitis]GGD82336.1 GntR family transcriptional regulator [Paenibacillus nasutitermitis]